MIETAKELVSSGKTDKRTLRALRIIKKRIRRGKYMKQVRKKVASKWTEITDKKRPWQKKFQIGFNTVEIS